MTYSFSKTQEPSLFQLCAANRSKAAVLLKFSFGCISVITTVLCVTYNGLFLILLYIFISVLTLNCIKDGTHND